MSLIDDIKNLDPEKPGVWPLPVQLIAIAVACAVILYAGWHFDVSKQQQLLTKETNSEVDHRQTFERKQKKAVNLKALKEQMKEMEQSFGDMIRQLPNKTEVAGLIVDISQTGLAAGLEFNLFQPQGEKLTEFYYELPININVKGNYHQLGEFVSGIATLPRIVTTHDITITRSGADSDQLSMSAVAKTYRALEEEEG